MCHCFTWNNLSESPCIQHPRFTWKLLTQYAVGSGQGQCFTWNNLSCPCHYPPLRYIVSCETILVSTKDSSAMFHVKQTYVGTSSFYSWLSLCFLWKLMAYYKGSFRLHETLFHMKQSFGIAMHPPPRFKWKILTQCAVGSSPAQCITWNNMSCPCHYPPLRYIVSCETIQVRARGSFTMFHVKQQPFSRPHHFRLVLLCPCERLMTHYKGS